MRLYLVQHAKALPKEQAAERPLSPEGRAEAARIAAFVQPFALPVGQLWHSGKRRAAETAEIYAPAFRVDEGPAARDGLAPGDPVTLLRDELTASSDDTMIVGHMPFVSRLASLLLTGYASPPIVTFVNAGIVCLERTANSTWQLRWSITPDMLPEAAKQ